MRAPQPPVLSLSAGLSGKHLTPARFPKPCLPLFFFFFVLLSHSASGSREQKWPSPLLRASKRVYFCFCFLLIQPPPLHTHTRFFSRQVGDTHITASICSRVSPRSLLKSASKAASKVTFPGLRQTLSQTSFFVFFFILFLRVLLKNVTPFFFFLFLKSTLPRSMKILLISFIYLFSCSYLQV